MKSILFLFNNYRYFESHKKKFILELSKNYKIYVLIPRDSQYVLDYRNIIFLRYHFTRRIKFFSDIYSIINLYFLINKIRPDIVHAFTIKPIIFANILSKLVNIKLISNFSGLGIIFSKKNLKYKFYKFFFIYIVKLFSNKDNIVITQTNYDKNLLLKYQLFVNSKFFIVPGSGIEINKNITDNNNKNDKFIVLMSSRLLKQKGLDIFCKISNLCKNNSIEFHLIGKIDNSNPDSYTLNEVKNLIENSNVKWFGYQVNTSYFYKRCDVLCFPSVYGEGIPKSILEASSFCRPTIAFDSAGLDEIIIDKVNGYLINKSNILGILDKIIYLYNNPKIKIKLGNFAERLIRDKYNINIVNSIMKQIHQDALK